jgi:hypothetical protein
MINFLAAYAGMQYLSLSPLMLDLDNLFALYPGYDAWHVSSIYYILPGFERV